MSRRAPAALLAGLLAASAASAQQVELQAGRGPHYVGIPIEVVVSAVGFEEEPQPEIRVADPAHGELVLEGVTPSVRTQMQIVGGRVTQTRRVSFQFRYRFTTDRTGLAELGPFELTQGSTVRSTAKLRLQLRDLRTSDQARVVLDLPDDPLYVGQLATVAVELWVTDEVRESLHAYRLVSPLFGMTDSFRFEDAEVGRGETELVVETPDGSLSLRATATRRREGDQSYMVFRAERTVLPLRAGEFALAPTQVVVDEATRSQRGFFGQRTVLATRKWRAQDRPRTLTVAAVPALGRPASFGGAVGRGFSLDVDVERSVVQAGDPIALTLTLRGEGNLETAGLPPLAASGLRPRSFRVPDGELTGHMVEGAKRFQTVVRVLDETVEEIPALAYSWFDPERGVYETTRSRPIALSVRPARVIGAEDVVSGTPDERGESEAAPRGEAEAARASRRLGLSLTGADLAIERDPARARANERAEGPALLLALYAGGLALVGFAWWTGRRAARDPETLRRRRALREELAAIDRVRGFPSKDGARELARALRALVVAAGGGRSAELDALLAECEAVEFAPGEAAEGCLDPALVERAAEVARALARREEVAA